MCVCVPIACFPCLFYYTLRPNRNTVRSARYHTDTGYYLCQPIIKASCHDHKTIVFILSFMTVTMSDYTAMGPDLLRFGIAGAKLLVHANGVRVLLVCVEGDLLRSHVQLPACAKWTRQPIQMRKLRSLHCQPGRIWDSRVTVRHRQPHNCNRDCTV